MKIKAIFLLLTIVCNASSMRRRNHKTHYTFYDKRHEGHVHINQYFPCVYCGTQHHPNTLYDHAYHPHAPYKDNDAPSHPKKKKKQNPNTSLFFHNHIRKVLQHLSIISYRAETNKRKASKKNILAIDSEYEKLHTYDENIKKLVQTFNQIYPKRRIPKGILKVNYMDTVHRLHLSQALLWILYYITTDVLLDKLKGEKRKILHLLVFLEKAIFACTNNFYGIHYCNELYVTPYSIESFPNIILFETYWALYTYLFQAFKVILEIKETLDEDKLIRSDIHSDWFENEKQKLHAWTKKHT